jgi:hypothetical protein
MSLIKEPPPAKLFLAAFGPDIALLDKASKEFGTFFDGKGEPDLASQDLPIIETAYYQKEMGPDLFKRFMTFPGLMDIPSLPDLKLKAMELERNYAKESGQRRVNLDPGYVFAGGLVLSTAKFSGHRLYLGQGIWGELTLHFHRGAPEGLNWTYRDYLSRPVKDLVVKARQIYLNDVKNVPKTENGG